MPDDTIVKDLIKNSERYDGLSPPIVERIRFGKHALIHRRTNLMYVMKDDFLHTNRCDFVIGKKKKICIIIYS